MLWREMVRLRAGCDMFVDRLPWLVWAGLGLGIVGFWGLAGVGAVTVARWVLG